MYSIEFRERKMPKSYFRSTCTLLAWTKRINAVVRFIDVIHRGVQLKIVTGNAFSLNIKRFRALPTPHFYTNKAVS